MDFNKTERILVGQILMDLYAGAPKKARRALGLRTYADQLTAPFSPNGKHVNRIVEIGCGFGFTANYLALLHPNTQVVGIDPDADKIAIARETARGRKNILFYTPEECTTLDLSCDVMILNQLLWRADFSETQQAMLETAPGWLKLEGELLVRALDPETRWWKVLAENLRETVLAGEALTTLSREDLTGFCRTLGFAQNDFKLDGMYYRAGRHLQIEKKQYGSAPKMKRVASITFGTRPAKNPEHDEALDFIFAKPWDGLKV